MTTHEDARHRSNGRVVSMAGTQVRTEKVVVTPDLARRWLGQNTSSNRNVSRRTVEAYAGDMKAGRWKLTHQGLAFNVTGELVDGQHRLHAVVMSDVSVTMMVTTGLAVEYNSPIDQGYNRSIGHLTGKGTRWASVVRGLVLIEGGLKDVSFKSTVGLIEECAGRHTDALVAVMAEARAPRACPTGVVAALVYAYPVNHDKILAFTQQVNTGELLEKGDPALHLRRWIEQGRRNTRESVIATLTAAKAVLQNKQLVHVPSGRAKERDGSSSFTWFTIKRRGLKLFEGTPDTDSVLR